jgi:hypothetical protein
MRENQYGKIPDDQRLDFITRGLHRPNDIEYTHLLLKTNIYLVTLTTSNKIAKKLQLIIQPSKEFLDECDNVNALMDELRRLHATTSNTAMNTITTAARASISRVTDVGQTAITSLFAPALAPPTTQQQMVSAMMQDQMIPVMMQNQMINRYHNVSAIRFMVVITTAGALLYKSLEAIPRTLRPDPSSYRHALQTTADHELLGAKQSILGLHRPVQPTDLALKIMEIIKSVFPKISTDWTIQYDHADVMAIFSMMMIATKPNDVTTVMDMFDQLLPKINIAIDNALTELNKLVRFRPRSTNLRAEMFTAFYNKLTEDQQIAIKTNFPNYNTFLLPDAIVTQAQWMDVSCRVIDSIQRDTTDITLDAKNRLNEQYVQIVAQIRDDATNPMYKIYDMYLRAPAIALIPIGAYAGGLYIGLSGKMPSIAYMKEIAPHVMTIGTLALGLMTLSSTQATEMQLLMEMQRNVFKTLDDQSTVVRDQVGGVIATGLAGFGGYGAAALFGGAFISAPVAGILSSAAIAVTSFGWLSGFEYMKYGIKSGLIHTIQGTDTDPNIKDLTKIRTDAEMTLNHMNIQLKKLVDEICTEERS